MSCRYFMFFFFLVTLMTNTLQGNDNLVIELSGKIVKKHFNCPAIVKNPPYGWFVELDPQSVECMYTVVDQLNADDRNMISDFDLNIIQLIVYCDEAVKKCRAVEGKQIWVKGKISNPPYCLSPMQCYQLDLGYDLNIKELEQDCITNSVTSNSLSSQGFLVVEECCDKSSLKNPYPYNADITNSSDIPLELPDGAPEIVTTLKGKLVLRLLPGHPEYCSIERGDCPSYCWFLQLNESSFHVASTTPICGLGISLREILEQPNWFEVQLGYDHEIQDFCCEHVNQEISVQGYLFHAHTAHHHAPFLMDVRKIYQ